MRPAPPFPADRRDSRDGARCWPAGRTGPRARGGAADRRGLGAGGEARAAGGDEVGRGALPLPRAGPGPPRPRARGALLGAGARRLEGIGAEVEAGGAGEAFFEAAGLRGIWAGDRGRAGARPRASWVPVRLGAARSASAPTWPPEAGRRRSSRTSARREFLAPMPVSLLCGRIEDAAMTFPTTLERLGISTLGRLAGLPRDAVADRFGAARAACAAAGARRGRAAAPAAGARGDRGRAGAAGGGLRPAARAGARAADRPPARARRPARAGRCGRCGSPPASRPVAAGAGGSPCGGRAPDRARLADALVPHLALLPAPAATLRLEAMALGPGPASSSPCPAPRSSAASASPRRCARPARRPAPMRCCGCSRWTQTSRVPERREVLMPFPEEPSMRSRAGGQQALAGPGAGRRGRRAAGGRPPRGRVGARGVAGRGRLVDAEAAAAPLLRAGARGRQRRRRLLRARLIRRVALSAPSHNWFRQRD